MTTTGRPGASRSSAGSRSSPFSWPSRRSRKATSNRPWPRSSCARAPSPASRDAVAHRLQGEAQRLPQARVVVDQEGVHGRIPTAVRRLGVDYIEFDETVASSPPIATAASVPLTRKPLPPSSLPQRTRLHHGDATLPPRPPARRPPRRDRRLPKGKPASSAERRDRLRRRSRLRRPRLLRREGLDDAEPRPHGERGRAASPTSTSAQPVCSASRAALLTGCYPNRVGILGALGPGAKTGISSKEKTIAEVLAPRGYVSAIYGKWHLGHRPEFLPTRHGFDDYFGLPYSNDMRPTKTRPKYPPLPLIEGEKTIATEPDQSKLTTRVHRAGREVHREEPRPALLPVRPAHHAARAAARLGQVRGQVEAGALRRCRHGDRLVGRADPGGAEEERAGRRHARDLRQRQRAVDRLRQPRRRRGAAARGQDDDVGGRGAGAVRHALAGQDPGGERVPGSPR